MSSSRPANPVLGVMEHITRIGNFVSASYHVVDRPNGRPTDPFGHRIGAARIGTTIGQPNGP